MLYKKQIQQYNQNVDQNYGILVKDICSKKKVLKSTYTAIIKKIPYEIKAKIKWTDSFKKQFENNEWHNIFTLPKKTTLDSQTRIFQYKILHKILPTNKLLYIYNIKDDPSCDKCPNTIVDLEHSLHLCPVVLELWYTIAEWLSPEIDMFQYINSENIILGIYTENKLLYNTIILAIKRYIYLNKCNNTLITMIGAKFYLRNIMLLETNTQSEKGKMHYIQKWQPIFQKLV